MSLEDATDFGDLMDLAERNKPAALLAFEREYDEIPIELSTRDNYQQSLYTIDMIEDKIVIQSYKYFKKFINIFGHLLKRLRFEIDEYSFATYKLATVYKQVSKQCISLKELRFVYDEDAGFCEPNVDVSDVMTSNPLRINTPIQSLEILFAKNVYLKTQMKLDTCFPNLKSLHLMATATVDPTFIEVNMPSLTDFRIEQPGDAFDDCDYDDDDNAMQQIDCKNVENMIRLNPQLENVFLDMDMDFLFLQSIRDFLPSLQKLSLGPVDLDNYNGADIVFANVKSLNFLDVSEIKSVPPITSECLVELEFAADENAIALEYIKKHPSLKILRLECNYNLAQVLELIASLPDLMALDIKIDGDEWKSNDVIRLLTECERLDHHVGISVRIKKTRQNWQSRIPNTWRIDGVNAAGLYIFEQI